MWVKSEAELSLWAKVKEMFMDNKTKEIRTTIRTLYIIHAWKMSNRMYDFSNRPLNQKDL